MATWQSASGKVYLPPSTPVARVQGTDEYVERTNIYYHAYSDRLLTVGHPYFNIYNNQGTRLEVPKVSGNQHRVFRLKLPDPNRFALADMSVYNPDKERLVWGLKGIEIGRGQPLGIGSSGHPLFNKVNDTENGNTYRNSSKDDRQNISFDPKQLQMFIIGCTPCIGEHWDRAPACVNDDQAGRCPPIELINSYIQDGDMADIGYGNINFKTLQQNRSDVSLDIVDEICKYPDFLKMQNDVYGDACFFYARREQCYARHFFVRGGKPGDDIPASQIDDGNLKNEYYIPAETGQPQKTLGNSMYFPTISGSLVSSDAQLFNRPFWLQRAQGHNNGILWGNQLFVTVLDNTRNTNFSIAVYQEKTQVKDIESYDSTKFNEFQRHVEEYEVSLILQLCKIPLKAEVLAQINAMNSDILENWQLGFVPTPDNPIHDTYRYLDSLATRCPEKVPVKEKEDPYAKYVFWNVDLSERLSLDLDQYSLGRKFLFQAGLKQKAANGSISRAVSRGTKRKRK
ncbi:L1 [Human papillomavirus type 196]|uniref:Major capsid protein L1 n=5 Tax=Human papillomavirus TaxID=10566 RepID=A0A385PJS7_9PAPI|nr:L1 [Human papillomavirus type 196]AYA94290.1 MAG: L1 protein [Human papillomavirus]